MPSAVVIPVPFLPLPLPHIGHIYPLPLLSGVSHSFARCLISSRACSLFIIKFGPFHFHEPVKKGLPSQLSRRAPFSIGYYSIRRFSKQRRVLPLIGQLIGQLIVNVKIKTAETRINTDFLGFKTGRIKCHFGTYKMPFIQNLCVRSNIYTNIITQP